MDNDASGVEVKNDETYSMNTVTLGSFDQLGTITAGTLTIECRAPVSSAFETPSVSTIDFANPERVSIEGEIARYRFTITGFAGTAESVPIGICSYAL